MEQELELARKAAGGDVAAFTALVRAHEGVVRRFLTRLAGAEGADDLAQEVFLKAWRLGGDWRGEGSYRSWLMGIAWTQFLGARRANARSRARDHAAYEQDPQVDGGPDAAIDLSRALGGLAERERAAVLLCFGEGCSHAEAARIMDVPLGTLKSIVARGRSALAARLEERS